MLRQKSKILLSVLMMTWFSMPAYAATSVTKSVGSGGRDFSTMQAWESAREGVLTTRQIFDVTAGTGTFVKGETVTGGSSGCNGIYVPEDAAATNGAVMTLDSVSLSCTGAETLTGGTSGATATFNLVSSTDGTVEVGELYNDAIFTGNLVINGSTTDATHYLHVTVASGNRHSGVAGTGVSIAPASASHAVQILDDYTRIEWVEITDWTTNATGSFDGINIQADNALIQYVIVHDDGNGAASNSDANGITLEQDSMTATVRNSIVYNIARSGITIHVTNNATLNIENTTLYNCVEDDNIPSFYGCVVMHDATGSTINAKNVIAVGPQNGGSSFIISFAGGSWGTSSNNISSNGSAPGAGSITSVSAVNEFVSIVSGSEDFHLISGADALATGVDLSSNFTTDIDAASRSTPWDIGADDSSAGVNVSGTCKQVNQSTDCTDTGTIRVAVNNILQAETQATVAGTWTISNISKPSSGDVITVYIAGAADSSEAVAVSTYDGSGNITGIELIEAHLTIGSDDNQTVTNSDLSQYDNSVSGSEDIFHEVNASNDLTVDTTGALTSEELYIKTGNTYRPDISSSGNVTTLHLENRGTLIANGNTLTVSGNWENTGTLTAGTSTVIFNGTNQTITGSTTFNNFSKTDASDNADSTLTFDNTGTQTINGLLTLDGFDNVDDRILLVSDSPGNQWGLTANGTFAIDNVLPTDSDASGGTTISHTSTTDGGNNLNWGFVATISGTVYTDEATTLIADGAIVHLLVNGADAGTDTTSSGAYSFSTTTNAGDVILVYIDGHATDGTTVTVSAGGAISGLDIYGDRVITRHDNSVSLSNANMSTALPAVPDADIEYSVSGGNLTVNGSGTELYVFGGHSFSPGGAVTTPAMKSLGTFNGGSAAIDINGALLIGGGSFTATSGLTSIQGNFTISAGIFTHNSGSIKLDHNNSFAINIGTAILNHLEIDTSGFTVTVTGTVDVDGNLTLTALDNFSGGTIQVAGNVTSTDTSFGNSGTTVEFDGGGAQVLSASGGTGSLPSVSINKGSGTLTLQDIIQVDGSWTYTAGTVAPASSTISFTGSNSFSVNSGVSSFNHVSINTSGFTMTTVGTMDVNGDFTIVSAASNTDGGTITVGGNLISSDPSVGGTTTITLDGAAIQNINVTGDLPDGTFTINQPLGGPAAVVLLANFTTALDGVGQDLTITQGRFDLNGFNLTVPDVLTVDANGTLQLEGGETTVTYTTLTLNTGSTVLYDGGGSYTGLPVGNTYSNLSFNNAAGTWTLNNALDVDGNLTITNGTFDVSATNHAVNVAGNWSNSGTFTPRTGTVVFDGTNQTISGSTVFNNFTKSVASTDTLTFAAGSSTAINGTATLNGASGQLLNLRSGTPGTRWNFTLGASAIKAISFVDVQDSDASTSDSSQLIVNPTNATNSGNNVSWFGYTVSGRVFEDANFNGAAADWDGGASDQGLDNVDVELYDNSNVYISSTTTSGGGLFSFNDLANATYKIRVRSATVGDADTVAAGGHNACVPASCANPLPEMSWANGAALYGGQSASVDDTATGDDAGPGDTYVSTTVSGADIGNINFGFAYNLIVNTSDDNNGLTTRSTQGSLRQFIKNANAIGTSGGTTANSSEFRIPASDANYVSSRGWRIAPASALPAFTDNGTTLDATTQTSNIGNENAAGPEVELDGSGAGAVDGLMLTSANHTITGFIINGYNGSMKAAILIDTSGATGNTVSGNYLGTNYLGTATAANTYGVSISNGAQTNVVGGTGGAATRNLISGNTVGVIIQGTNSNSNEVKGNYVGTNAGGTAALANTYGVVVASGGQSNIIGGNTAAARNILSGSTLEAVVFTGSGTNANEVKGNYIGTDVNGTAALPNNNGVLIESGAQSNIVGGTAASDRNIISGNTNFGVEIKNSGTDANQVKANYVGTDVNGTTALPNAFGVYLHNSPQNNIIGGTTGGERNVISGNTATGVQLYISANSNQVTGNYIGTDVNGTAALPNTLHGVYIGFTSTNNVIGGTAAGAANVIAFNGDGAGEYGVFVEQVGSDGNVISANAIFNNFDRGINLAGDGANNDQAAPAITTVTPSGGNFTVTATLTANDTLEFFRVNNAAAPAVSADGSGSGEGYLYLGTCTDNGGACSGPHISGADATGGDGTVTVTLLSSGLSAGDLVTATTTDATNGTSEFSANATAPDVSGTVYTDDDEASPLSGQTVRLLINGVDSSFTDVTDASGNYAITASHSAGDVLLVYIDSNGGNQGTTVTVSDGGISGLNIYQNHVNTRHDNGGALTNANMATATNGDGDIPYTVSGGNLTVNSGMELFIPASHGFSPGGDVSTPSMESRGTFNGGSGAIAVNGIMTITSGSYTASSGTTTLSGSYTYNPAATFAHGSGTTFFPGTNATITGSHTLNNVIFNSSSGGDRTWTIASGTTLTVAGTLTLDNTTSNNLSIDTGTIAAQGNIVLGEENFAGSATLLINGGGTQSLTGSGGILPNVNINTGTLNLAGTMAVEGNWTLTGGTLNAGTSTLQFRNVNGTITGSHSLNNVRFDTGTTGDRTWNIAGGTTLTVTGTLTLDNSNTGNIGLDGGTIAAQGNITLGAENFGGTATLLINGSGTQTLTGSGGFLPNVNFNGNTMNLAGSIGAEGDWTHTGGTLNAGSSTVRFGNVNASITGSQTLNNVTFNTGTNGDRTWTIAGGTTLTAGGTLTFDNSGNGVTSIDTGTLSAQGNVVVGTGSVFNGSATLLFSGSGTQSFTLTGAEALLDIDIDVNKSGGQIELASGLTMDQANQDLDLQVGTFDLNGNNLSVSGAGATFNVQSGANFQLQGGETTTAPTLNAGSTVTYDGSGSYSGLAVGDAYSNLTFNGSGTWTLDNALDVNNNLTITSGTLDVDNIGNYQINVAGNWSSSGTFTARAGTVVFDGTNQTITGSTTFNNFSKTESSSDNTDVTLTFDNTATQTINGLLTLDGLDVDDRILLVSDSPGTQWGLTANGTFAIDNVRPTDSDASGGLTIVHTSTTDGGNNLNWGFTSAISGAVYTDEGSTLIADGALVRLLINGIDSGTGTTSGGIYSIAASPSAGDAILVYIDGHATDGTTVTISPGGALTGLNIYGSHLITRHDNGGALTNAHMNTAKVPFADSEILYSVSGGNLTVSGSGPELFIPSSHSFTPGGNVTTPAMENLGTFNAGANTHTINGAFVQTSGSFNADSASITISGDWTYTAGTVNRGTSTVIFDTNATITITGSHTLNNVTFAGPGGGWPSNFTIASGTTLTINGTMIVGDAVNNPPITLNTGDIHAQGDITINTRSNSGGGTATLTINGTGAQTFTGSGTARTGFFPQVVISKPSGTLSLASIISIGKDWTYTSGGISAGSSTLVFDSGTTKTITGSHTLANVIFSGPGGGWDPNYTIASGTTLTLTGNLGIANAGGSEGPVDINTGTINVQGNVTVGATAAGGTSPIIFSGTNNQSFTSSGDAPDGLYTINKTSGTLSLASAMNLDGTGQDLTITQGTLDLTSFDLTVNDVLTVDANGTLQLEGGETVTTTTTTLNTGSTVLYDGGGSYTGLAVGNLYSNLIFNNVAGTWTLNNALDVNSNLTITAGTLDVSVSNHQVNVAGNWSNSGTFTPRSGTVVFDGTNQTITGSTTYNNFSKTDLSDNADSTLTFDNTATQTINGLLTLDGFDAVDDRILLVSDSPGNQWGLTANGTFAIDNVRPTDSDASGGLTIVHTSTTDGGNNLNWGFASAISGAVYTDEGSTLIADGAVVRLLINGIDSGMGTTSGGIYSIAASPSAGDAILVYIDGHATDGTTVTISPGGALTGLNIYGSHLITRHDNGGALTNAHMNTAKVPFADSEILYSVSGGNLTVSGSGTELYVLNGHTFTPGGDVTTPNMESLGNFDGGSGTIDINAALVITSGNFTSTSGNLNIEGGFTIQPAAIFTHNSGTIFSDGSGDRTLNTGTAVLNNLQFSIAPGSMATVSGNMDVNGDLTLNNVDIIAGGGSILVGGNVTSTAPTTRGSSTVIRLDGTGVQTISVDGSGGTGAFPGFDIVQGVGGSVNLVDNILIDSSSGFTHTSGTVNAGTSNVIFGAWDTGVNAGSVTFNDVSLSMGSNTFTVTGTMNVGNNFTVNSTLGIASGTVAVSGNVTTLDATVNNNATVLFTGSGNQLWSAGGGSGELPFVAINKSGGTLTMQDTLLVYRNFTHTLGTVDAGTSTVIFDFWDKTVTTNGMSFNNVAIQVGGNSFTASGILDINGNFTITSAANINSGTFEVAGNILSSDVSIGGNANITLNGTGNQTIDTTGGTVLSGGTLIIDKTSGTASLLSNLTASASSQDLTITQGTLDLNGFNLTVNDVFTVAASGTLQLEGGETVTTTTTTLNTGSTVLYDGAGSYTGLRMGNTYSNLSFNNAAGTWSLNNALDVNNNLTITNGTLDVSATNHAVNVAGNWANSGTFTPRSGTVVFDGTNQTISGSTTFNNFSKTDLSDNTDTTLTFDNTGTQTINGLLTLDGFDNDDRINLVSDSPGNQWSLVLGASVTKAIDFVDVQDSDASGSDVSLIPVNPISSVDSGNNVQWFSGVTGIVYTDDDESIPLVSKSINLLINGSSVGTTTTNVSGVYSIPATPSAGDLVSVFIDNEAEDGTTVTVSNGSNLSNLNIYQNHVVTRHDNAGALTNADLSTATNGDADIRYSVSGGNLSVSGAHELFIPVGHSYSPGGNITTPSFESRGTFNGGSGSINVNGDFTMTAGSFTSTSGNMSISSGDITISGGTFTHNSGTLTSDGGTATINSGGAIFNDVVINSPGDRTVVGTMDINGDLTITGVNALLGGTIAVAGNVTTTDSPSLASFSSTTLVFDGTLDQTLSAAGGSGTLPGINVNKGGGILFLQDSLILDSTVGWTHTAGTVDAGTSTVVFDGGNLTIDAGITRFNDVTFNTSGTVTTIGTLDIDGDLLITTANSFLGGLIAVAGNLTNNETSFSFPTSPITLDGTGTQIITSIANAYYPRGTFTINKASGIAQLSGDLSLDNGLGQDLTITQGTLDLNGFNLTVNDVLTVDTSGTLQLEGGETVTRTTTTLNAGSTVLYDGSATYSGLTIGDVYSNLTFDNAAGTWTLNNALDVNRDLTITNGILDVSRSNFPVNVAGTWNNGATFVPRSGTVILDGFDQTIIGSSTFNHFSKTEISNDATDVTLTFDNTATQTINGVFTLDGLDADDRINVVSDSPGNQWSLVLGAGVTKAIDFVDVQDSDASGSDPSMIPVNPLNAIDSGNNIQWFSTAVAATATLVEITPNFVAIGSTGNAFTYDLLPTIGGGDTGIDRVIVTAPPGYANLAVTSVSVGGTGQSAGGACPSIGAGEYCATIVGQVMTVTLGTKVTTSLSNIRIGLSADAPSTVGSANFTSTIDDSVTGIPAQATTVGDADGDAADNNSITVQVVGRAVTSVVAEIAPNAVPVSATGNTYTYDLLPTIMAGDTGINQFAVTVPAGHSNLLVTGLSVGGSAVAAGASCPTVGAGEYCVNIVGQSMTVTLGTLVTTSLTPIRLTFSADAPATVGSGDATATVDDIATITAAQAATTGDADGDSGDANSITVATGDLAASAVLAEIFPNTVVMNATATAFTFDLLPTISPADTGIDQVAITAPAGYGNLNLTGISLSGANQTAGLSCPAVAAGEYCTSVSGQVMTVTLGSKVVASLTNIQARFTADVPGTAGSADFSASFNDTSTVAVAPQSAVVGDADGDGGDANSLRVNVRAIDATQSSVSAAPSLVEVDRDGDGNPFSTITIIPRDTFGADLGNNLNVTVSAVETAPPSGKPADVKQAPGDPFGIFTPMVDNGDGTYTTQLSSPVSGIATVRAAVNGVPLTSTSIVTFTAGQVLKISKTAHKKSGVVGDVITYEVEIQNTTNVDVHSVTLNDKIPSGFKYLRGSTLLNGQPAGDPSGNQTRAFNLGTIAAWVDQNGNGLADTGDLGNLTLSYQLVIGSGVKPGDHFNVAQAVDFAAISNQSRVKVQVNYDPIFDLGTLIGKVFFDKNKNGYQDRGEAGVSGARVVLDNGTYVDTDDNGRYHFPGVRPGQRLLKINKATLPPGTTITTEAARIVAVSRGLLTKVNFGVVYDIETEHIGRPGKQGVAVAPTAEIEPTQITGHLDAMKLLVNGDGVKLPTNQAYLGVGEIQETVEIIGESLSRPIPFSIVMEAPESAKSWRLEITDADAEVFRVLQGEGSPPKEILWDGKDAEQNLMKGGAIYTYQFKIDYQDGSAEASTLRLFGVNKTSAISLNLLGSAFAVGSAEISKKTETVLHELAQTLKKYPDEKITIEGHTDNTGSETFNLNLSKARAEAAMRYLVEKKNIDPKRFSLKWFGEGKPIASNRIEEGRSVNRRVEIVGSIKEVQKAKILNHPRSEALMTINGIPVKMDADDRFSTSLEQDVETLALEMASPQGEVVKTTLIFPNVDILAPAKNETLVFWARNNRYLALPLPKGGKKTAGLPVASYRLQGKTEAENQVWVDGKVVKVRADGIFETDILLKVGENLFTIAAVNPQRVSRLMTLKVDLSDRDERGRVMMAIRPIPQISILLPPKGKVLSHTQLPLRGMTDPGNAVWVNDEQIVIQENGTFSTTAELKSGKNNLIVDVVDPEGYRSRIERELTVDNAPFFLMALADGEFGQISTSGYLQGAGADKQKDYYSKGRLAYYLKGKILGKYLITSAFDSGKGDFDQMFQDLDQAETDRFFTNIDPDKFYPVYGDDSTVVYDAETQGKFYLAIDGDDLNVLVGNYKTDLNDTELTAFNRTFYGGRAEYRSLSKTQYGAHDTKVIVFGAQVRQAHVQNTFRATGGSLYYLSEKDIIEGSEQVRLEVRDQDTGLVLAKIDQVRDADYSFKYEEGRILFRRPISSVVSNDLLLRQASLQGHPVFVLVDFEYEAQDFDKKAVGARVRQQVGDHFAVGGTLIEDAAETGDYELKGADAEVRLGQGTKLVGEYAESVGKNSATLISEDGGLSFTPIASAAVGSGSAYKVAVRSDLSEWFGAKDRLVGNAYYKRLSPEFFSNGTLLEEGTLKYGGGLKAALSKQDTLRFRYDFQEVIPNANAASANQVGAKQVVVKELTYDHRRGPLLFSAGFHDKRIDETNGGFEVEQQVAGGLDWKLNERVSTSFKHQQLIRGEDRYRSTLGLKVGLADWLDGIAEGAHASDADTALLGFSARIDERSTLYVNETLEKKQGEAATWGSVLGGDRMLTERLKLYGEYGEQRGNVNQTRSLWGLDQGFGDDTNLKVHLNYERSHLKGLSQNTTRDAAALSLRYAHPDGSRSAHRFEVRLEKSADKKIQRLTTHQGELKILSGLTLFGKFNFSDTKNRATDRLEARFTEAGFGVAYRPIAFDRLNLITKYTFLMDQKPDANGPMLKTEAHVTSMEAIYDISRHFQLVEKYAIKIKEETQSPRPDLESQTDLWINRLNFHVSKSWDIAGEYRILKQSQAKDQLEGYAVEVNRAIAAYFRFGVGYNFSRFTDNEFSDNNYDARGWFIRVQGKY